MKKIFTVFMLLFPAISVLAQAPTAAVANNEFRIDEYIDKLFQPIVDAMAKVLFYDPIAPILNLFGIDLGANIPLVVLWLVIGAIYFTFKMNFINFRGFKHAFQLVAGKYDNPNDKGEVSHFQALATALSATVGLGNIAGVAVAISLGGPGATFWMIFAGFLGMSSKFVECTLGVKYRKIDAKGVVSGGPMYYLNSALAERGLGKLGKVLAVVFAILCI
jgi:alanine or glycine:cation symporter, AGCS family